MNFFHQASFGRFSLFFSKSYKFSTIFFQTEGVPGNPQKPNVSAPSCENVEQLLHFTTSRFLQSYSPSIIIQPFSYIQKRKTI
ncbi:hypothetical protein Hanom_Chr01g00080871 [Helianthus anomalus]